MEMSEFQLFFILFEFFPVGNFAENIFLFGSGIAVSNVTNMSKIPSRGLRPIAIHRTQFDALLGCNRHICTEHIQATVPPSQTR